jgi:hypothetical protein
VGGDFLHRHLDASGAAVQNEAELQARLLHIFELKLAIPVGAGFSYDGAPRFQLDSDIGQVVPGYGRIGNLAD